MGKKILVLKGVANVGKTKTIKKAYNLLTTKFPNAKKEYESTGTIDVRAILTINGVKIGIESQGDPSSRLFESIKQFVNVGCKVIICATRTSGATVKAVESQQPDYEVDWYERKRINNIEDQNQSNQDMAETLFAKTVTLINA